MMRAVALVLGVVLVIALLPTATDLRACGPTFQVAVLQAARRPDLPLRPFAEGRLGVLSSEYARSYLVVAYRHLSGVPMSAEGAASVERLWQQRLGLEAPPERAAERAGREWLAARNAVSGVPAVASLDVYASRRPESYLNVYADAFRTAIATLAARQTTWGASSPLVRAWVLAEDAVFAGDPAGAEHVALPPDAPALANADRRYQIAAAHFYAGAPEVAAPLFAKVAEDAGSPWQGWGRYLEARALVRADDLDEAVRVLQRAVDDPGTVAAARADARALMSHVRFRREDAALDLELATAVLDPAERTPLGTLVGDLTWLIDGRTFGSPLAPSSWPAPPPAPDAWTAPTLLPRGGPAPIASPATAARDLAPAHELYDWVLTFQNGSAEAATHAWERWQARRSRAWLVAALALVPFDRTERFAALLDAAAPVAPGAPEYETVAYHRARLLVLGGRYDEANAVLTAALGAAPTASGGNALRDLRRQVATGAAAYVRDLPSTPVTIKDSLDSMELPWGVADGECVYEPQSCQRVPGLLRQPVLGPAAAAELDRLPLSSLSTIAKSAALDARIRINLTQAAFARAVVFEDDGVVKEMATTLAGLDQRARGDLEPVITATDPVVRRFAAALFVLRRPAVSAYVRAGVGRLLPPGQIENYRDNWWCSGTAWFDRAERGRPTPWMAMGLPRFPAAAVRASGGKQYESLIASGGAGEVLGRLVLAYAAAHPDAPELPEALHRVVKVTRYGCASQYSRRAFRYLHSHFPDSEWAKKTPFYF